MEQIFTFQQDMESSHVAVQEVYRQLITAWNEHNAAVFSALFHEKGNAVGFDGSQLDGREAIKASLQQIFTDHTPPNYIYSIKEVRNLTDTVVLLKAVAGMTQVGSAVIMPGRNAVQSLVACLQNGKWQIALFQNTPAKLDGNPGGSEAITRELQALLK